MAFKKKSVRQASKKSIPGPGTKRISSSKKGTSTVKKGATSPKKKPSSLKKDIATRKKIQPQRSRPPRTSDVSAATLEALNERLDIMLPEVMFRIAAIEHLLVKNQLCLYDELTNARNFIQDQEST